MSGGKGQVHLKKPVKAVQLSRYWSLHHRLNEHRLTPHPFEWLRGRRHPQSKDGCRR